MVIVDTSVWDNYFNGIATPPREGYSDRDFDRCCEHLGLRNALDDS